MRLSPLLLILFLVINGCATALVKHREPIVMEDGSVHYMETTVKKNTTIFLKDIVAADVTISQGSDESWSIIANQDTETESQLELLMDMFKLGADSAKKGGGGI